VPVQWLQTLRKAGRPERGSCSADLIYIFFINGLKIFRTCGAGRVRLFFLPIFHAYGMQVLRIPLP
jgi:hypothetical protein